MRKQKRLLLFLWFWIIILVIEVIMFAGDIANTSNVFVLIIDALCLVVTLYEMGFISRK